MFDVYLLLDHAEPITSKSYEFSSSYLSTVQSIAVWLISRSIYWTDKSKIAVIIRQRFTGKSIKLTFSKPHDALEYFKGNDWKDKFNA